MPTNWWDADPVQDKWWEQDTAVDGVMRRSEPGLFEELTAKVRSGFQSGLDKTGRALGGLVPDLASDESKQVEEGVARGLGYGSRAEHQRAQDAQLVAQQEREFQMADKTSSATERGMQEISEAEGPWDAIKAVTRNPRAVAATTAQSLGMMAPGMVAATATGVAAPAVIGAQSMGIEYESTLRDVMAESGVDLTDAAQVRRALDDPELMARAKEKGMTRGVSIGAFDAFTAGVAGRLLAGARGTASTVARTAGETGAQLGGGVAGEAVAQLATEGEVTKWGDVAMEGIAEVPTTITEVPTNYRRARSASLQREADTGLVQDDYRDLGRQFGATITSLTRSKAKNDKVGGVANSQHLVGTAGDFVVPSDRKDAFKAEARKRGYEVVDEGDHIHLELPGNKQARQTTLEGRREQRRREVLEGSKAAGVANVEDVLDAEREKRGIPLDRAERNQISSTDKTDPATPSLEREQLLRDASDPLKSPAERREAKRRAQQAPVMPEPTRRLSEQVERLKEQLLDQITQPAAPVEPAPIPAAPATAPIPQAPASAIDPNQPAQTLDFPPGTEPAAPAAPAPQPAQVAPATPDEQQPIGGGRTYLNAADARNRLEQVGYDPARIDEMTNDEVMQAMRQPMGWEPERFSRPEPAVRSDEPYAQSAQTQYSEAIRSILNHDRAMVSALRNNGVVVDDLSSVPLLQRDEVVQVQLEPEDQAKLEQMSRLLGRKVVMFDTPGLAPALGGFAADDRHIFLNPRGARAGKMSLTAVLGHEFAHTLRRQGNKELEALIAYAKTKVNSESSYIAKQVKEYTALYGKRKGVTKAILDDKITEEHIADLIGDLLDNEAFWAEMALDDPSLFRRTITGFIEFLRRMASRARRIFPDDRAFNEIETLRAKATQILKSHIKQEKAKRDVWSPIPIEANIIETPENAADYGLTLEELQAFNGGADYSLTGAMTRTFTSKLGPASAQLERWFLDEFRDVREIQKMIASNVLGGRVPPSMDFHRNENLRHGAYKDARERAEERFIKPVVVILSKAKLDMEAFSRYLWLRHASERDAYLRSRLDPAIAQNTPADALAGIDPYDAQAEIANLPPATRKAFERAAKFVDGMRKFTNDRLLASGQITQDRYDAIMSQYQHYVPLRGLPPDMDGTDAMAGATGQKMGLSMNRNALGKRATGRKSDPENIIEHMIRDMDNALVGEQKQRVLSSLVRLIAAHPDPTLWEVQPITHERKWVNGVLTVVQTNGEPENQITFMHHGIPVKIEIRNAEMRKAMLNLNEPMPQWLRRVGRVTRWLSAVKTAWSPFFLLVNPVRDAGLATMGLMAEHGMDSVRSMGKYYMLTHYVLAKDSKRKVTPSNKPVIAQLQQYAREFAATGGKTGYTYVNDIREQQAKLKNMMARYSEAPGMKELMSNGALSKDGALLARKLWQHTAHLFEVVNDMAENSTRLAVYAAMRDKGMSVEDAASYAKEVTVNFNRRGSANKILGGFYMFFNAAVQGGARMARLMKNPRFIGAMGALFATSYSMALGQMLAAGDDDDGESLYLKAVSDSQAQRTLSIHLGADESLALPVPYGPNIFSYMGHRLARVTYDQMRGKRVNYGKVVGDIMAQAMTSMSPLDPGKGMSAFLPEMARIPTMAAMNKNDFGGPIAPKLDPRDRTGNPNFYDTDVKTGLGYRWLAQAINDYSGGDDYEGGKINWTGEQVRYVLEQFSGGLGRLASQSYELVDNMLAGIDPEPSDVPLANVYYRGKGHEMHAGSYYDNLDDYKDTVADWKLAIANGDEKKVEEILERAPWVDGAETDASTTEGKQAQQGSVMEQAREIERQMKALRKEKDSLIAGQVTFDDGTPMSRSDIKRAVHEINQEIAELQQDFNYAINAGRGNPVGQR